MQSSLVRNAVIPKDGNSVAMDTLPQGLSLRAIQTPALFEGTTLTFAAGNVSPGAPLFDGASSYSLACGASRYIAIPKPELFVGLSFLQITSNVSGSPSNVGADRLLTLFFASE
jgi:hypothetical protein